MSQLPKRLNELSPDRRQLLERWIENKTAERFIANPQVSAQNVLQPLSPQKAECRRFYDEISRQLDAAEIGPFSLFLNLGYAGNPSDSLSAVPEHYLNKNSVRLVLETIGRCDLAGRRVLDVGCGRGGTVSVLKQFFCAKSICAVDLAPAAIQFCRAHHRYPEVTFDVGDAERLAFPDESFDVVTNIESSSTYPDICAFFHEVWRVLAPGGHFLYTDALVAGHFTDCTAYLQRIGFRLELDRDITSNVLASCDEISSHRMQAYGAQSAGDMNNFLAAPGSSMYEAMKRGEWTYRIQRWGKPGGLFG